ncbi:PREDICTED: moesin/ezrin/radixin homolog 1-like [Nicotiana attenuata]|uniref:moesin/ezrin/radixin homolog 1-like n=1 Tax=Nicotiana attenuata TaxID=49451 RepID=UPI0009057C45|nr:PREDICTED: moesin/ezrin/radixin homolog 1-like [Nicotiana attenuata]
MVEIESARRADTRAKIFLTMLGKYRRYRDKCREMHERLRTNLDAQSHGEELEKRDQQLMKAIRRSSVLEEQLRAKDEELELANGVAAECEHLQEKLRSMQSEMDQNLIRVEAMSVEWMGKLKELERKVAGLESIESAWSSALARAAALENTIRVLQSEQESERATTTLREARLEERISEIDQEDQLLAQVESSSTAAPRHLHELWVHAEAQQDIYKSLWEAGKVTEASYKGARAKAREARVNCGYDSATPKADEGAGDEGGSPGEGAE